MNAENLLNEAHSPVLGFTAQNIGDSYRQEEPNFASNAARLAGLGALLLQDLRGRAADYP
jgi:hypothetical protein